MIWKVQIYHQHTINNKLVYIPKSNNVTNFAHGEPLVNINILLYKHKYEI